MAWFKRTDKGIQTPTEAKRDTPKGLWYKKISLSAQKMATTFELEVVNISVYFLMTNSKS